MELLQDLVLELTLLIRNKQIYLKETINFIAFILELKFFQGSMLVEQCSFIDLCRRDLLNSSINQINISFEENN